jgi:hypothetical protein
MKKIMEIYDRIVYNLFYPSVNRYMLRNTGAMVFCYLLSKKMVNDMLKDGAIKKEDLKNVERRIDEQLK